MSEDPVAGWYADPTGRFEYRYWDGSAWTEHVARHGRSAIDALDGSTVHAGTEGDAGAATASGGTGGTGGGTGDAGTASWEPERAAAGTATWEPGAATTRTNSKAVVSLVLSLLWVFGLASVVAVVLGVMARREIRSRPDEGGEGFATAGIVIGVIGIAGGLLMFLAVLFFFVFGAGMSGEMFP